MKKETIHFKHSNKLEFIFVCPECDAEEGCYNLGDLMRFGNSNECGNCGKTYPAKMPNVQYHVKDDINSIINEKIDLYLYYIGTPEGAEEFSKLDRENKTDSNELAGTTRIFKYCFKEFMEEG